MSHVLTLAASAALLPDLARAAERIARELGTAPGPLDWLDPGRACDLPLAGEASGALAEGALERALREVFAGSPVDLAVQPAAGRRKKLLLADMESTVIANEMLEELAEFVGLRERVERITTRAMNGELDFRASLIERVALLRGLPEQVLHDCLELIRFDPGAPALVSTLKAHGVPCALVSGGFTFFAEWVAARVGFEFCCANQLQIEDGRLAGTVAEPILDKGAKLRQLEQLTLERGLLPADAATVGDGANDLPMLLAAGLGVAYHGKPAVAAAARFRVDHGDLTTLLHFQGYRRSEISGADSQTQRGPL